MNGRMSQNDECVTIYPSRETQPLTGHKGRLQAEIARRKQLEARLRSNEARLEALHKLIQMTDESEKEIARFTLRQQLHLTESDLGWLGFMDENDTMQSLFASSESPMDEEIMRAKPLIFKLDASGLWENAQNRREPLIINDYSHVQDSEKGLPQGHLFFQRIMLVPLVRENSIVALTVLANKKEDYDDSHVQLVRLLMDSGWKLIHRKRLEKERRESERLMAMGKTLSALAHDMKVPLVAMGGFTRRVMRNLTPESPDHRNLSIVFSEVKRLERMVRNILDFSKPFELELEAVDVEPIIGECLALLEPIVAEKGICLESRRPQDLPPLPMDPSRVKQALLGLLVNAIQASPQGGRVVVTTRRKGKKLVIEVKDEGTGIPEKMQDKIFKPFFTTKKDGNGLGLAIAWKIMEAHGGRLRALNNPLEGATFTMELPLNE